MATVYNNVLVDDTKTQPNENIQSVVAKRKFPKIEGLKSCKVKEYTYLGEIGLEELVPDEYRSIFSKRDCDGNFVLAEKYEEILNAKGYGKRFIDQLRRKKGDKFLLMLKENTTR